jgi:hypothetical protein
LRRNRRNARGAEHTGDEPDDEKDKRVIKHWIASFAGW